MLGNRMIAVLAALSAIAVGAGIAARPPAGASEGGATRDPEIIAATFASAWCSSCRILEPALARVMPTFDGEKVAFVKLDFTFGPRAEIKEEAARWGIADLYERNKGATGFTLLVDADTGAIVDTLTMNFSEDAMRSAIARALAVASYTDEIAAAAGATQN